MKLFRQALVALLANGIVLFLALELNSFLAPWSLYLSVGGILVVYPALKMQPLAGFPVVLVTGALWDAATPAPFGLFVFILGFLFALLHQLRNRFRTRRTFHLAFVSLGANLILLIFVSIWYLPSTGIQAYGLRFLLELVLSESLVFLLAYWIFDLQETTVSLIGAQPSPDEIA